MDWLSGLAGLPGLPDLPQIDLGGWGVVVWIVGGLLVAAWIARRLRRLVRGMLLRRVLMTGVAALYGGVSLTTLNLGGFVGQDHSGQAAQGQPAQSRCQQVRLDQVSLGDAPAHLICRIGQGASATWERVAG